MKIALVTRDYNARGGVEKISQYYARILQSRGHSVHLWCSDLATTPEDAGIAFHRIKLWVGKGWLYVLLFALIVGKALRVKDYDAVIVMGVSAICPDSYIVANSVHQHWFRYSLSNTKLLSLRRWLKIFNVRHYVVIALEKLQYRAGYYRKVIAVSEPIKAELSRYYSVPEELVEVLPNGADFSAMELNDSIRNETRKSLGLGAGDLVLCMLANELERKGVRQTMCALQRLCHENLKLLIVGRLNRNDCLTLAKSMQIAHRVLVEPSTSDVRKYLWASDAYVLPTQYEAWNLSIMEAHAAGLPVITTKLGQADLVVDPGVSGILLNDPLDVDELTGAIQSWLNCVDKESMSRAARERAKEYSWENLVSQLERIIGELPAIQLVTSSN